MFCHNCGNELPDSAKFCDKCGAEQILQNEEVAVKQNVKEKNIINFNNVKNNFSAVNIKRPKAFVIIAAVIIVLIACIALFVGLSNSNNIEDYYGSWVIKNVNVSDDMFMLDIYQHTSSDCVTFELNYNEYSPIFRLAGFEKEILRKEIKGNKISFEYEDDYWGNSGTCIITLKNGKVKCEIKNVENPDGMFWGVLEGEYFLSKKDTTQNNDNYDEVFYEDYYSEPEPVFDTSKASGILAENGLTEQEFRDICIPLVEDNGNWWIYNIEYMMDMLDYPNNYVNNCYWIYRFEIDEEGTSSDGYPMYHEYNIADANIRIYDFRDDTYSPNLSVGDEINAYLIFKGLQTDDWNREYYMFWMLSCDLVD